MALITVGMLNDGHFEPEQRFFFSTQGGGGSGPIHRPLLRGPVGGEVGSGTIGGQFGIQKFISFDSRRKLRKTTFPERGGFSAGGGGVEWGKGGG